MQDEVAPRSPARHWQLLVVFSSLAIMAMVLIQCGRGGVETVGDGALPSSTATRATSSTPEPTTATTPAAEAPTPTVPIELPPAPPDMADPEEPGIVFEHNRIDIADASIIWDGNAGLYRLYATNDASPDGSQYRNVPMWTSPNLRDWTLVGDVMPRIPAWAQAGHTWAPEIRHFGFIWVLYSTITDAASGRQCIAYSMSLVPEGPFTPDDSGPMICQLDRYGSIDASIFTDFDGSNWILWKSEEDVKPGGRTPSHLFSQRVDERGVPVGEEHLLLTADEPWQDGLIESPSMAWGAMRYWLFLSGGSSDNHRYSVAVTACAGPAGPCEPATEDKVLIRTNKQGEGPGEQGVMQDNQGNLWLAYNPWAPFIDDGIRPLALAHIKFAWFGPYVARPPESFWK